MNWLYDSKCRVYCATHRAVKRLLGRSTEPITSFVYCYTGVDADIFLGSSRKWEALGAPAVNDTSSFPSSKSDLFYGENVIDSARWEASFVQNEKASPLTCYESAEDAWKGFLEASVVPEGWRNSGLHTVCWSRQMGHWALSSWIWASAALARYHASVGDEASLARVADALMDMQRPQGGWVVRHDFVAGRTTPMIAPNDSAYIANNALLSAFEVLGDAKYLHAAERCAVWIMETAQSDGLVYIGQDAFTGKWISEANIVDIGFTGALFARLYTITGKNVYWDFLSRFTAAYVSVFRNPEDGSFATSIDCGRSRRGGKFARGQAWALEGLMPAAEVLDSPELVSVVESIVRVLVSHQMQDGGWAYNLEHPLMGQDCKGIPVIAKALSEWGFRRGDTAAMSAAAKALDWSRGHTLLEGAGAGGIYSYCLEGCVTHNFYSEAAFTYSSSYALEASAILAGVLPEVEGGGNGFR